MTIPIAEGLWLELTTAKHAEGLYQAVDANRAHLAEFLPWVGRMQSVDDFRNYIQNCELLYQQDKEISFVIMLGETLVGRIGLHYLNHQNKCGSIGYWLTKDAEGRGIITQSCRALISYGFQEMGLHRIELKAATGNVRSQAVPERLHFKKEGMLREAELVNGQFLDLYIYSLLAVEWVQ